MLLSDWTRANPGGSSQLDDPQRELLRTTRWEQWKHGETWHDRLLRQADAADHVVVVSPTDRATAVELLRVDADRVSDVPNGVDVIRFCPRPMSRQERRAHFRHWLVEDPQGWDETAAPGTVAYREPDLDRLLGPDGDAIVLIFVGRFTSAKRVPPLVRAFARDDGDVAVHAAPLTRRAWCGPASYSGRNYCGRIVAWELRR